MTAKKHLSRESTSDAESLQKMLAEALKRPGVADIMKIYRNWQEVESAISPHRIAMSPHVSVSASTSSD